MQLLEARNKMQDLRTRVAEEEREIARLRSQLVNTGSGTDVELRTTIEANLRQISELDAQIRQARLQIQYGVLTAPSDGVVFDIEASAGSVVGANETTPLLKVVPQESLRAKVYLPNKAIGFVQVGQSADLSIETFPANDFGYVPAKVERIGSDALTPEEQTKVLGTQVEGLHFPVILQLERQTIPLQRRQHRAAPGRHGPHRRHQTARAARDQPAHRPVRGSASQPAAPEVPLSPRHRSDWWRFVPARQRPLPAVKGLATALGGSPPQPVGGHCPGLSGLRPRGVLAAAPAPAGGGPARSGPDAAAASAGLPHLLAAVEGIPRVSGPRAPRSPRSVQLFT